MSGRETFLKLSIYLLIDLFCMRYVCMHVHSRVFCGLCVKARGQLAEVSSHLPSRR